MHSILVDGLPNLQRTFNFNLLLSIVHSQRGDELSPNDLSCAAQDGGEVYAHYFALEQLEQLQEPFSQAHPVPEGPQALRRRKVNNFRRRCLSHY